MERRGGNKMFFFSSFKSKETGSNASSFDRMRVAFVSYSNDGERELWRKLRHFSAECPDLRRSSRSLLVDGNVEQSYSNKTRRRRP